jgi:hypothetical protein
MGVKKCENLAFVKFKPESVSYIHADMDPGLCSHIWRHIEDLYASIDKSRPTKRNQVPFLKHLIPLLFQFKKTIIAYQKLVFQFHGTHNQNVLVVLEVSPDLKL